MIHTGDCVEVMAAMEPESIDAIVTDPPYGLGFMGKAWDKVGMEKRTAVQVNSILPAGGEAAFRWEPHPFQQWTEQWATAAYRVAKPSAYLLAFGGTRTVHRLTCALEDAGWIIRDLLVWGYASGFPKSKASLKPAWEPIVLARKPGPLRELAIDACRIGTETTATLRSEGEDGTSFPRYGKPPGIYPNEVPGRWPANIVLSDPILEPGVPGVVIAQSLTGTMTAWQTWSSEVSDELPTPSPVSSAGRRSSRTGRVGNSRGSAIGPVGTQLDAWGTSTDTPKPDTGCSDGTTADDGSISGSTGTSGSRPTDQSPAATSSTTRTGTASTTGSRTSNSSPVPSTLESTSLSGPGSDERLASETLSDDSANWRRNSPNAEESDLTYSRYFLIPKADRADREPVLSGQVPEGRVGGRNRADGRQWDIPGSTLANNKPNRENVHPTVKPTDLMRHLVRLVTPSGGTVLDPFLGSGTTGIACELEGFPWVGIEREEEYVRIAEARLNGTQKGLGI